ncbi:MAG: dTMP kinase [Nanobdellota archaeon]
MSRFITFEGGEGSGKSTQIELLKERLEKEGFDVIIGHEPGTTEIGLKCREMLKSTKYEPNSVTELLLFETSRSEFVEKVIRPALKKGKVFIADRFFDSTTIYQGIVRGLGVEVTDYLNKFVCKDIIPDMTIVLDVDNKEGVSKALEQSRFELEGDEFHKKINSYYKKLKDMFPERNIQLVKRDSIENVHEEVFDKVIRLLRKEKSLNEFT